MTGCSVFESVGSIFHSSDDPAPAPAPTQFSTAQSPGETFDSSYVPDNPATTYVTNASSESNDSNFTDPFAPGGFTEPAAQVSAPRFNSPAAVSSNGPAFSAAPVSTPVSAPRAPGAGIFGEIGESFRGAPAFGAGNAGADNLDQISFSSTGADFDPNITPDGKFILYASTQHSQAADIYRKSVSGSTITQLTSDPSNDVMPELSPDGSRIAFASDRDGTWNIYLMNAAGGQSVQLTNDASPQLHPTWSPDGQHIAYCRLGAQTGRWELWVLEVQNPAVRHFIEYGLLPEWSPTGNKIAFQRARQRGDRLFSVWTIDFDNGESSNPTEIISSPTAACVNPTFSPDGHRIALAVAPNPEAATNGRPAVADVWITNLDGSDRSNLTRGNYLNLMPTWGSDHRIYFISDRSGNDNIWALRPGRAILAAQGPNNPNSNTGLANASSDQQPNDTDTEIATVPDDKNN